MIISAICFTEYGYRQLKELKEKLPEMECFCKCSAIRGNNDFTDVDGSLTDWAGKQFVNHRCILFVGACGIAVRTIALHIVSKLTDSPVIVMDDEGRYVIPVLSGHFGGANELAAEIAGLMGAVPVITTSTDLHDKFAADVFAAKNGLIIKNKAAIAPVSANALRGKSISLSVPDGLADTDSFREYDAACPGAVLLKGSGDEECDVRIITGAAPSGCDTALRPLYLQCADYTAGIGCRRGKTADELYEALAAGAKTAGLDLCQISMIASVDLKKDEEGLLELSERLGVPFRTFSAECLQSIPGDFSESAFVKEHAGVGNVCERAALAGCGTGGRLVLEKQAYGGITVAIAGSFRKLSFTRR